MRLDQLYGQVFSFNENKPLPLGAYLNAARRDTSNSSTRKDSKYVILNRPTKSDQSERVLNIKDPQNIHLTSVVTGIYSNRVYNHELANYSKDLASRMMGMTQRHSPAQK